MMKEMKVTLTNDEGLHGRAAANFVRVAGKFTSDVKIILDDVSVNGKSIIGIMSLGAFKGEELLIRTEGTDENMALKSLSELVNQKFKL